LRSRGFPKLLPCPLCADPRTADSPGDRMHPRCREKNAQQPGIVAAVRGRARHVSAADDEG
jgi:hypothetical protein